MVGHTTSLCCNQTIPFASVAKGIEWETKWHETSFISTLEHNPFSLNCLLQGMAFIFLNVPLLDELVFRITYVAYAYFFPNHVERSYQGALRDGNVEGALLLIEDLGADIHMEYAEDNLLDVIAKKNGALEHAEFLIDKGITIHSGEHMTRLLQRSPQESRLFLALTQAGIAGDVEPVPLTPIIPRELTPFLIDISLKAENSAPPPFYGREQELYRIEYSLNPLNPQKRTVLIGPSGVGKTALLQQTATRLKSHRIIQINSRFLSQQEEIILLFLAFLNTHKNIVVYFDNLENLDEQNFASLCALLKRIEAPFLLTSTEKGFKSFKERSGSSREIHLTSPPKQTAFLMCLEHKDHLETSHGFKIEEGAFRECITLCSEHCKSNAFPGILFDVLNEAITLLKAQRNHGPLVYQDMTAEYTSLTEQSTFEKRSVALPYMEEIGIIKEKIPVIQKIFRLEQQLFLSQNGETTRPKRRELSREKNQVNSQYLCQTVVNSELIRRVVSHRTNISLKALSQDKKERLLNAQAILRKDVVGQEYALSLTAEALGLYADGLGSPELPVACLLYAGSSGTGKTSLTKALVRLYGGNEKAYHLIPGGQYPSKEQVNTLAGSSPGYVGSENVPSLADTLMNFPECVLVFDELERSPILKEFVLNMADQGFFIDMTTGKPVSCRKAIIIATTNVGSEEITAAMGSRWTSYNSQDPLQILETIKPALYKQLGPPLIGRFTTVPFVPFQDNGALRDVVLNHLEKEKIFWENHPLHLEARWDETFITHLIELGKSPEGIRPIRDYVQKTLRSAIRPHLHGSFEEGTAFTAKMCEGNLVIANE